MHYIGDPDMSAEDLKKEIAAKQKQLLALGESDGNILESSVISAVSVKIPKLSTADPVDWFRLLDSIFRRHNITKEITKFDYAIQSMDWNQLKFVRELYRMDPLPDNAYKQLKEQYISATSIPKYERAIKLKNLPLLGDSKPFELYLKIAELIDSDIENDFRAHEAFLERMPSEIVSLLQNMLESGSTFKDVAKRADALVRTNYSVSKVECSKVDESESSMSKTLDKISNELESLRVDINAIKYKNSGRGQRNSNSYRNYNKPKSIQSGYCYFHQKFGHAAFKCVPGCNYPKGQAKP